MHEIANNQSDFVIADEIKDDFIYHYGNMDNLYVGSSPFDIEDLCQTNKGFNTYLKRTLASINELEKNDDFINNSLDKIQNFISEQMPVPLNDEKALNDRIESLFENEPFSYFVEHKECMCAERAAMAQYLFQQIGIKSYLVSSFAKIQGINDTPEPHSYIIFENNNEMFVYDPANPRTKENPDHTLSDAPRILDTNMNKTIFEDFIEAVNYNSTGKKIDKKRVGFHCIDPVEGRNFIYCSTCGVKGQTTTPKKLKEIRYGANKENKQNQR